MSFRRALCRIGVASVVFAGIASGATFSLNPIADTFVSSANPTANYGGAGALPVSASALPKGEFDSLLQFDFSGAKTSFDTAFGVGQWNISALSLQLTLTAPNNSIFNGNGTTPVNFAGQVSVKWMQNDSWQEGTGRPNPPTTDGVTFTTLPTFLSAADAALGSFAFSGATSGNLTLSLGLAPSMVLDATAGNPVSLLLLPGDNGVATIANSRSAQAGGQPTLTVTALPVPEPCGPALSASAAFAWLSLSRRRNRNARKA